MEEPVNATPRVPEQTSPDSQASHLCQACLSVLTMDELEVGKTYPHHNCLKSFLDAHQMRCYICSPLLGAISEDELKTLRTIQLLVEGKISEPINGDCGLPMTSFESSMYSIREIIGFYCQHSDFTSSSVSLTGLRVRENDYRILQAVVYLNPAYDEALQTGGKLYEASPSTWMDVLGKTVQLVAPAIISAKGSSGLSN